MKNIIVVNKPWGDFVQFTKNEISTVKILTIQANQKLSLQNHIHREELWVALDDGVIAEGNGEKRTLSKGEKIFIPKLAKHRLSSKSKVRVLEISFGHFDEEDIIRYQDDYGRA
jgi:mannose-6-phosphate isomerase